MTMTAETTRHDAAHGVGEEYRRLVDQFPLHVLTTAGEYDVAAAVASSLAIKGEENLTADERAYLDVLDMLIESYDDRHGEPPHAAAPNEVLKHLMDSNGMKPADLGKLLGSQPLASMVLSGKRELSKAVIVKLASHFGVSPAVFF